MVFAFCAAAAIASPAQITFTKLQDFSGPNGANPAYMSLIQGIDGDMYGTTLAGGTYNRGSIFFLTTNGGLSPLYDFCPVSVSGNCTDGASPYGGLVQTDVGALYGTTSLGGDCGMECGDNGTIFKFTLGTTPLLTPIYNFTYTGGAYPYAGLVQGSSGVLYGITYEGGTPAAGAIPSGTIFSITITGTTPTFTTLYNFCTLTETVGEAVICTDGEFPISGLVETGNGTLYGTTSSTAFSFSPGSEKLKTLYPFCTGTSCDSFEGPYGTLIQGNDGSFYGTSSGGGKNNYGMIFKITPGGSPVFTDLYDFCSDVPTCLDGGKPTGTLVQGTDGSFYGTTQNGGAHSDNGTIFKFTPTPTATLVTLYSFCLQSACSDGSKPYGGLVQDTNGTFYGTTYGGGAHSLGTIFSLSVGLGAFVETKTSFGKEQTKIGILGQGFSSGSAVTFGGVTATFTRTGTTFISATVPAGALTGPVTVTTTSGTLISNKAFHVLPTINSFTPSGEAGTAIVITGTGLLQTTKVTFYNGKSVTPSTQTDTEITATVPAGATTGKVTVTTKGGSVSTSTNFTVD
jgi:uncharacterized repeat protein (TIGR03803 family)